MGVKCKVTVLSVLIHQTFYATLESLPKVFRHCKYMMLRVCVCACMRACVNMGVLWPMTTEYLC